METYTDSIIQYNKERWQELVKAGVEWSLPFENLTKENARMHIDPHFYFGSLIEKSVLCLASGGGQQSAAFGVLGSHVTVADFIEEQLEKDIKMAQKYGFPIDTHKTDMRDLSIFDDNQFDIIVQEYSINYIPDPESVFHQVARIIKPGGFFRFQFANPLVLGGVEHTWNGSGYVVSQSYLDCEVEFTNHEWEIPQKNGPSKKVTGPRQWRHTFESPLVF